MNREDLTLVPWQGEFFTDPSRYRIAVCGRRSGKTTVARAIIYNEAMSNEDWLIWYVAPTFKMARRLMFNKLLKMFPKKFIERIDRTNLEILLKNGTEVCCKGSDSPDSLLGEGIHFLVLDEYQSQKEDVWWTIRPTLSDHQARVVVTGTPRGYNHFHELWWRGWDENTDKLLKWSSYQITTASAGTIPQEEIEDAKATMGPKEFAQEYEASFESLTGLVYYAFDPQENVRGDIRIEQRDEDDTVVILPIRIGMDFNLTPMTAIIGVIVGKKKERKLYIVDEVFLSNSNTDEMISVLQARYGIPSAKGHEFSQYRKIVYPDPAGGAGNTSTTKGTTNHTKLQDAGYFLKGHDHGHAPIVDTVNEVNAMFCNANGERRLFIHPRCQNLIRTLKGLTYTNGAPDKKSGLDHMSDCLRYLVHEEFPINREHATRRTSYIH